METPQQASLILKINTGAIALTSIILTIVTMLWHALYGYGRLSEKIDSMQGDITELKVNMNKLEDKVDKGFAEIREDLHKMDIRLSTLEQRKP